MKLIGTLSGFTGLWRHVAPKNTTAVVVTVSVLFGAMVVFGIYHVQNTGDAPLRRSSISPVTGSERLGSNDPAVRFLDTGVGQVLYSPRVGDDCQRVLFDNRTGVQYDSAPINCIRLAPEAASQAATDRVGPMGKGFQK